MISLTSPVRTRAHGWPAGAKLGALCLATMGLFALEGWPAHLAVFAGVLGLYAAPGRAFLRGGIARLRPLWPFVLLVGVWHSAAGEPGAGAATALRMGSAVGLANLVTMTTRLSEMMELLHRISAPLRRAGIPTRPAELAMALAIRFAPALTRKGAALTEAWRARSTRRAGWRVALPFALLALDDADRVAEALRARGGAAAPDPDLTEE